MLTNYLTIALRTLRRHTAYTVINVTGLAIGMACCLLLLLYVQDELRYDRHHEHADRIHRLVRTTSAMTGAPMGPALVDELPGVEAAARITVLDDVPVRRGDGDWFMEQFFAADSSLLDIFTLPFVAGSPADALTRPDGLLLSETAARRYFGDGPAVGQTLTVNLNQPMPFTVTGVFEDLPRTSHVRFDVIASFQLVAQHSGRMDNWATNWLYTYLLLADTTPAAAVEAQLPTFFERHTGTARTDFTLQPLLDVRLHSSHLGFDIAPQGSFTYVLLFSAIAVLILLIACINFMNLATARSASRAREVGVRKALGARRSQLVRQFLGESLVMAGLALVLALGLVSTLLPAFRSLTGKTIAFTGADGGLLVLGLAGLTLLVGLVAGSYPAFVLSAFEPVQTLTGTLRRRGRGAGLRRGLVVVQFTLSVFLIAGTLVVYQQLDYVRTARLGFDGEQVVVLPIGEALEDRHETIKAQLRQHPNVRAVTASDNVPGETVSDFGYRPEGWTEDRLPGWNTYFVDADFVETLGLTLTQGRAFASDRGADSSAFLINEAALRALVGDLGDAWQAPVGKQLDFYLPGRDGWAVAKSGPIVGVIEDFHYRSLHERIEPLVLQILPYTFDNLLVQVGAEDLGGTLAFLEQQWTAFEPTRPFTYSFLDARFDALYRTEEQIGTLVGYFAGLAILIACLGLFGLAAFTAEQHTKEIGIRKVLGATVPGIVVLLTKDLVRPVLVAIVLAAPLAYLAMGRWLEAFAYRTDLHPGLIAAAGGLALLVALLTVSTQSIRTALLNPTDALRHE